MKEICPSRTLTGKLLAPVTDALAIVCIMLGGSAAPAQVINFDVPGGVSGGVNYSGQGAYSDPGHNYWNPVAENSTTSSGLLSDGMTASPITLTDADDGVYGGRGPQGAPGGLQTPFELAKPGPKTETLNHVPSGNYTLYLYGINGDSSDSDRGTTFTVWSDLTSPVSLSTLNTPASYTSFINGNDYVQFQNVISGRRRHDHFYMGGQPGGPQRPHRRRRLQWPSTGVLLGQHESVANAPGHHRATGFRQRERRQFRVHGALAARAAPFSYQWQKETNGVYVSSVDGATYRVL